MQHVKRILVRSELISKLDSWTTEVKWDEGEDCVMVKLLEDESSNEELLGEESS
jgi:hypothetical protein